MDTFTVGFDTAQAVWDRMTPPEPSDAELAREEWECSDGVIELLGHDAANEVLATLAGGDQKGAFRELEQAFSIAWAKLQKERRDDVDAGLVH